MVEAESTSETSVNFCRTTWHYSWHYNCHYNWHYMSERSHLRNPYYVNFSFAVPLSDKTVYRSCSYFGLLNNRGAANE
jgi:hypothetical protein